MSQPVIGSAHPLVSIVLPVRNGERFLREAIDTVLAQEYEPLELIVVDDHSVDRSGEIARSVGDVRCIPAEKRGLGSAWNTGVRAARGSLIAFQASDDLWAPDRLERQVAHMVEHPEVHYSVGKTRYFVEPGESPDTGFRTDLLGQDVQLIIMESVMVRRAVFDLIGYFDESLSTAQEVDWRARANDAGLRLGRVDQLVLHKRVHGSNMTFDSSVAREGNQNLMNILMSSIQRKRGA